MALIFYMPDVYTIVFFKMPSTFARSEGQVLPPNMITHVFKKFKSFKDFMDKYKDKVDSKGSPLMLCMRRGSFFSSSVKDKLGLDDRSEYCFRLYKDQ